MKLTVKQPRDRGHSVADLAAHLPLLDLDQDDSFETELDAMVAAIKNLPLGMPDQIIATCMALMARCTEIRLQTVRSEALPSHRHLKFFRTQQLQPVMELIEFTFRGASRLVESNRQELELTR